MGDHDVGPRKHLQATRGRPNPNRIYQHLGVRDLREIIDRKRNEKGNVTEGEVPPPDPSYNYLKDPLREGDNSPSASKSVKPPPSFRKPNKNFNNNLRKVSSNHDIKDPLNIKVEFSTSTGEHVYKLDENTVLPTIKHVPDHMPRQTRGGFRGRFRERGRGPRNYHNRTVQNSNKGNEKVNLEVPVLEQDVNWDEEQTETKEEGGENEVERIDDEHLAKQVENLNIEQPENEPKELDDNKHH